jgi:PIN domain nuclease of toxin-antitoxin system
MEAIDKNEFILLEVDPEHIKAVADLPFLHRDPFDRMLVAQAMAEDMVIMTADVNILKYEINTIW